MTEVSSTNVLHHQDGAFLDVEINDFAELSNLLGEDFTSDLLMPSSSHDEIRQSAPLPEFNFISPPNAVLSEDVAAATYGQMLEPARVSPTPSASMMAMTSSSSLPSFPSVEESMPEQVKRSAPSRKISSAARKRKAPEADLQVSSQEPADPSKQKNRRRERNREHAKRSRSKKKDLTKSLEETVAMLREENQKMKDFVYKKLQISQEDTEKIIKERIVTPSEKFIAALKNPSNRVLSNSAISYLKSLGKDCKR